MNLKPKIKAITTALALYIFIALIFYYTKAKQMHHESENKPKHETTVFLHYCKRHNIEVLHYTEYTFGFSAVVRGFTWSHKKDFPGFDHHITPEYTILTVLTENPLQSKNQTDKLP